MRLLNLRQAQRAVAGGEPAAEGNVSKLLNSEHAQRAADLAMAIVGPEGAVLSPGADFGAMSPSAAFLFTRMLSIAGGTSEIGRNQIAERLLGLPRDPLIK
jgi:alkylation response protein AidB-like acyl-CoA dehydrogenase